MDAPRITANAKNRRARRTPIIGYSLALNKRGAYLWRSDRFSSDKPLRQISVGADAGGATRQ